MQIMLFLILVSLLLAAGFLFAYLRAARAGQFDDEYTPAIRMLFDDTTPSLTSHEDTATNAGGMEEEQIATKR
jgi:cbb3-type cytochrome oxidase maturation protein